MGQFTQIETLGSFHVPSFKLSLGDPTKTERMTWDVIDVSYSDDIEALDSFDITLADWDPVTREPVYSCPYDMQGKPKSFAGNFGQIPLLVPGTEITLSMGYLDGPGQMVQMMRGKVVSLTSSFPAGGVPVAKVRVLNPLADLEKATLTGKAKGGVLDVLDTIAKQLGLTLDTTAVPAEIKAAQQKQSEPEVILSELKPVVEIRRLARSVGLSVRLEHVGKDNVLVLAAQPKLAYAMAWGKTLLSFTPTISTKQLVAKVVVRGQNPLGKSAAKQKFEVSATWSDLKRTGSPAVGAALIEDVIRELGETKTVITLPNRMQLKDAKETAKDKLRALGSEMIRGAGQTVGLPNLRAGARVQITGVGSSFGGIYEVTKTTHALGASGYSTSFEGRKEIFA